MPVEVTTVQRFNLAASVGAGIVASGADANFGIRNGTLTSEANYLSHCDVLEPGWEPRAFSDYLDYTGGPFLPESQAEDYTQNGTNRDWLRDYADGLPGADRFKAVINTGGVTETGNCTTIADVLASDPLVNNSCRNLLLSTLDHLQTLQTNHKVDVVVSPFHEMNGDWYPWGWTQGTHSDFISLWQWLADEAHARGLLVAWTISIGPFLSNGLTSGADQNDQRWPGSAYVDVVSLNHYDKAEANRNTATLLARLQEVRAFALAQGCSVGLGEWGSGGHSSVEHLANTYKEIDTWPAGNVPGGLFYSVRWNPSSGSSAASGGGNIAEYYDFTRSPGITAYPARAAFESDMVTWVLGGKVGLAPYDNAPFYLALEP